MRTKIIPKIVYKLLRDKIHKYFYTIIKIMQINEQVLANLDFSLYAEDVNTLSDNERVDDILKKYSIEYDSSHLFASNENNYIVLTNYIIENL